MSVATFLRLPVDPDEGFPQSFRLVVGGRGYVFGLQVVVLEEVLPPRDTELGLSAALDLPTDGAYLVMTVVREDSERGTTLLRRKLVPGHVYRAGELAVTLRSARVAIGNLNGVGRHGSQIVAGVAVR
ncbi:hypothetical protein LWF15_29880 [Kineosporia rhizophila]|uniref:hypothetical protein n=1 Tax=Kineosporia TaxID=49184 RepID=UPI001E55D133|nr:MULTISPECIES: hypothetical protein [Kineosporia]MCE0539717.1 hypothetical protein [Kineosporia rhizophila]GLY16387.1 hypothetical protein Kisp01_34020 [Kineosporia sp. NBRC 101677]